MFLTIFADFYRAEGRSPAEALGDCMSSNVIKNRRFGFPLYSISKSQFINFLLKASLFVCSGWNSEEETYATSCHGRLCASCGRTNEGKKRRFLLSLITIFEAISIF